MEAKESTYRPDWEVSAHPARLAESLEHNVVQCYLSPRQCKIRPGQTGFCGVRQNIDGKLVTLNFGRATHATQESIETEAVFHVAPAAPILSLHTCLATRDADRGSAILHPRLAEHRDRKIDSACAGALYMDRALGHVFPQS